MRLVAWVILGVHFHGAAVLVTKVPGLRRMRAGTGDTSYWRVVLTKRAKKGNPKREALIYFYFEKRLT
jgi:hypothetical protein